MIVEIGRTDARMLQVLQLEGRLTNVELAERIGLSPSPCLRRLRQLEGDGLIDRYVALLDRRKLGLDVVAFVEVQVDRHSESVASAFHAAMVRLPEVVGCFAMTGSYDYLLKVVVQNLDAYARFAMERLLKTPGVKDVRSSFVLETVKDTTALPLDHIDRSGGG
jgi:Lrp/AsnC family leucine-responsive transcriptional regulator